MNFDLSEDEEMLKALAERFVNDRYDLDRRRAYLREMSGFSQENWKILGELGLIAASFPEEAGGLELDGTGLATVFEAFGRGLVVEPLIECVVLAGRLLAAGVTRATAEWGASVVTGERRVAFAHSETAARGGRTWIETRAQTSADGWVLTGEKACVPAGLGADGYIVSARFEGKPHEREGIGIWLLSAADMPGLTAASWTMVDGTSAVCLSLEDVRVSADCRLLGDMASIEQAQSVAQLARTAEAVGIMERMFSETIEYLRTREQFGVRLASFQAIQHRMVEQYAVKEQLRGLLNRAISSWGTPRFDRSVYGINSYLALEGLQFGHDMIQFHGGMGVTEELGIGQAHKRLVVLSHWPFAPDVALEQYAARSA